VAHPTDLPRAGPRGHDDAGAALVELAIVLPVLLMIIFGVYVFSIGYNAKTELTGAVREGARAVALRQTSPSPVQVVRTAAPGLTPVPAVTVVTACPATPSAGQNAVVRATHDMNWSIPFFGEGTWTITAEGVMRCGL
jgi:Flp pilus assembly protein TadG